MLVFFERTQHINEALQQLPDLTSCAKIAAFKFKRGQMVPQFDKVAFKGAILEPHLVKTKFGWHVIKVLYRT